MSTGHTLSVVGGRDEKGLPSLTLYHLDEDGTPIIATIMTPQEALSLAYELIGVREDVLTENERN